MSLSLGSITYVNNRSSDFDFAKLLREQLFVVFNSVASYLAEIMQSVATSVGISNDGVAASFMVVDIACGSS